MRIQPGTHTHFNRPTQNLGAQNKASFGSVLATKRSEPLNALKNEIQTLSLELKSGKITKEEASKQFASLIIEKKNELGLSPEKAQKASQALGDLIASDPAFVSKLESELKRV